MSKKVPEAATQDATAGPYSPVLEVRGETLVVISGQVACDLEGNVVGQDIEQQTRATLENCRLQLAAAGCTFGDVFKVTAYLSNLDDWSRFNDVYGAIMPDPKPVRTTIGCVLYPGFLVEIEMWAVKPA